MTHEDQILITLSELQLARCLFAHEDMDDTKTGALIGDGHAFGKKLGACHRSEPFDQPLNPQPGA